MWLCIRFGIFCSVKFEVCDLSQSAKYLKRDDCDKEEIEQDSAMQCQEAVVMLCSCLLLVFAVDQYTLLSLCF